MRQQTDSTGSCESFFCFYLFIHLLFVVWKKHLITLISVVTMTLININNYTVIPKSTFPLGLFHEISVESPSFSPSWFCTDSVERIKKELVYMTPGINVIPTRLCQHQEPYKWPLWLKCKGTPEIEVLLCCLEVGREQFNCHFVGTHRGLCSC